MAWSNAPLKNEFSWSKSRHGKLEECARAYYYHYYGSWGGWERGAAALTKELYTLKKLTTRKAWAGSVVHDAIAEVLAEIQAGRTPEPARTRNAVLERMRREFRESRAQDYRRRKAFGLQEHEYAEDVAPEEWKANADAVDACLAAFFSSRFPKVAAELSEAQWLPIDELGSFPFEGTKIYAAPDFAYRTAEGGAVVVDWKTGLARQSDHEQLLGYALFAEAVWGVPAARVTGLVVYLPAMDEQQVKIDPAELQSFQGRMRASIEGMRGRLEDPAQNRAAIEQFPQTQSEEACARCVFRRPCKG